MPHEPKRRPIWVSPELLRQVESLKVIPEEPVWRVVARLLDSYDLSHPKTAPRAAPESPAEVPA